MTDLIIHKAVYRTGTATQGLLIIGSVVKKTVLIMF